MVGSVAERGDKAGAGVLAVPCRAFGRSRHEGATHVHELAATLVARDAAGCVALQQRACRRAYGALAHRVLPAAAVHARLYTLALQLKDAVGVVAPALVPSRGRQ